MNISKVFVDVIAKFQDGNIIPLSIVWIDGTKYDIDQILDIRKAASLKSGGLGMRYTVRIRNKQKYLFLDESKWFIE